MVAVFGILGVRCGRACWLFFTNLFLIESSWRKLLSGPQTNIHFSPTQFLFSHSVRCIMVNASHEEKECDRICHGHLSSKLASRPWLATYNKWEMCIREAATLDDMGTASMEGAESSATQSWTWAETQREAGLPCCSGIYTSQVFSTLEGADKYYFNPLALIMLICMTYTTEPLIA